MTAPGESVVCPSCGTSINSSARFCEYCGAPHRAGGWVDPADAETAIQGSDTVAPAPTQPQQPPEQQPADQQPPEQQPPEQPTQPPTAATAHTARPRPTDWQTRLPPPFNTIPPELFAAYLLTTIAGSLTLYPAIRVLPDIAELLGESGFAEQVGLLSLTVWAILALAGVALIFLAWRMVHRDRMAHGLALVLLGGLAGAVVIGDQQPTELVLAMLAALAALAVLALTPQVRAFFEQTIEEPGRHQGQPPPILLARTLTAIWAAVITFVGVMFLPLRDLDGKFLPIGIMFIALGVAAWFYNGRLAHKDLAARAFITAAAGVYLVLLLVLGERHPGLLLPLALATGIVVSLWVPSQSQQHFTPT